MTPESYKSGAEKSTREKIKEINNPYELCLFIDKLGGIEGHTKYHSAGRLIEKIEEVFSVTKSLEGITNGEGLQDAVRKLLIKKLSNLN
jgi:hypothetical protein